MFANSAIVVFDAQQVMKLRLPVSGNGGNTKISICDVDRVYTVKMAVNRELRLLTKP